jgi:hypothetical protein
MTLALAISSSLLTLMCGFIAYLFLRSREAWWVPKVIFSALTIALAIATVGTWFLVRMGECT